ncbi:DNA polymerase III subunit chi [Emcibacter nanhaiensis]|uniref:DNA polymerase III subunit chi n=1 Tax=Emcibacter nanhaiensis TaxID=1505037 RepID=A0A501PR84_9PROT|nr:DNA polymerase III subunit chi [Emcibacter nanhaiensis]TPD62963.1 DNA polymerase III subunit chi [Emcibacter nanhaiensis]
MTDISFYHLQRQSLNQALPKLLQKVLERGHRAVVITGNKEMMEELDQVLWSFDPASFLPHGSKGYKWADSQPVYISTEMENPNKADVLVLTDGCKMEDFDGFARVLEMFDGTDPEKVQAARERWTAYKSSGHTLTYWQQTEAGGWSQKAS